MGLVFYRRRRIGKRTMLNMSKRGLSLSRRIGPVTLNSRGRGSLRLARGLWFRF